MRSAISAPATYATRRQSMLEIQLSTVVATELNAPPATSNAYSTMRRPVVVPLRYRPIVGPSTRRAAKREQHARGAPEPVGIDQSGDRDVRHGHPAVRAHDELDHVHVPAKPPRARLEVRRVGE